MIQIRHLTKRFGRFVALDDVSLDIRAGETLALLGPNGSGKTTTLKCVVGLAAPTSGEILVRGLDIRKHARETRELISYLPQRVSFHETLTAREVLAFYCRLRKIPLDRIEALLAESRFNGFADKPASTFSGGMVQRLGLAVACLADAPILILDEPTLSLDPEGSILFREFLATHKRAGKTILFSSHTLAEVEHVADRAAILAHGKVLGVETVDALRLGAGNNCSMRIFLGNPEARWVETACNAGARQAALQGNCLQITSAAEDQLEILRAVTSAGAVVLRFATQEASLEDIYLRYIHEKDPDSGRARAGGVRASEVRPG